MSEEDDNDIEPFDCGAEEQNGIGCFLFIMLFVIIGISLIIKLLT